MFAFESGVGHIGGNLSSLDLLVCLHHSVLEDCDAFVLSKGHAAGALYTTLWSLGRLSDEDLQKFHKDGTKLSGHPPVGWIPEILFATGSAGQMIARCLLSMGLAPKKFTHRYALGYVSGLLESGLDPSSIMQALKG